MLVASALESNEAFHEGTSNLEHTPSKTVVYRRANDSLKAILPNHSCRQLPSKCVNSHTPTFVSNQTDRFLQRVVSSSSVIKYPW